MAGNSDIEDSLDKLDKLTQEEARMASAELLKMAHSVDGKVMDVDDRVKGVGDGVKDVDGKVQDVHDDVQDVGNKVQAVDDRMQDIGRDVRSDVQNVNNKVQGVDDKLDQVSRTYLYHMLIVPSAKTTSQGISSGIVFCDGFRPQTHPLIITLRPKLITTVPLNGFFKAVYSINGNPLTPSYGYTESVR